ncbi:RNA polymerase I upstream activation factor complex subunit Rrn10 [Schizosaccharomyces japonicus yFS275]|uniref:RNA polymerase I upstream activation factor complex subunit Rrn10 n=1 Tax=Schizosaccharomyces japonicus (strain yFS275 / FY16936) TaxID=402676 RepID=B6K6R1_SCHJY|nr:RNA polymerase I upstream activation factor complex subunit Rrn10 [Schizosaccharomyces japonicus yFS275]EEB09215.1 RNA polymerase I upstream activation factor complex subunit Rrn10 [Schizosaccharomyces japonicus yFS275]
MKKENSIYHVLNAPTSKNGVFARRIDTEVCTLPDDILPDSDLVQSIQDFAAEYAKATDKPELFQSMDETALLALGIYFTEWAREYVGDCLDMFEEPKTDEDMDLEDEGEE